MIQEQMKLDGSLGPTKFGPIKHLQTQIDRGRIHADQFVLKPEWLLSDDLETATLKQLKKHLFIKIPWTMLVRVSQGGTFRSRDTQMLQFPLTTPKPTDNLSERMSTA
jgi:hypothetical protein